MPLRLAGRSPARSEARLQIGDEGLPPALRHEVDRQWGASPVAVTATLGLLEESLLVAVKPPQWGDPAAVARRFARAGRALTRERVQRAVFALRDVPDDSLMPLILGLSRGLYRFDRYKTGPRPAPPMVSLLSNRRGWPASAHRALAIAEATAFTRDLVNTPAEDMGPDELEAEARRVARAGGLKVKVLRAGRCARMGMGALTAVGRASPRAPRMIVLEYEGAPGSSDVLSFAGKGICFDTGGLDLKTASGMLLMKKDMGGAATILGAAQAIAALEPEANVRFYIAAAENAVAGNALRPGDVVRALDGTTIEIGNTDAEGRLVLADAVALAVREGATRIVDVATLTGAAMIALGRVRVPLLGNDESLLTDLETAAAEVGERVWRLPADPEYREAIKGKVADLRNVGRRGEAGVIAGGLFIGHFAGRTPWAHLDISPASWSDGRDGDGPEGATGVMVATLVRLALGDLREPA
ncbi:MAG: leucyl aminopeptidase family protein [Acidobacteria bacterium]|nr:MAG: leucyl aminopeptidase family protein [Acidobacteriota bacterium]